MKFPVQGTPLDIVKGSAITLALFLAYLSLPLIGLLPGLLAPAAGIYYFLKRGRLAGYVIVLVSAAVLAVDSPVSVPVYLLQCGVMTLALGEFLTRRRGGSRSIVYAVAINLGLIIAVAALYGQVTGTNLHVQVVKGINSSISQTAALYGKAGVKDPELSDLKQAMEQAGAVIAKVYPALITISLGIVAGLNLMLLSRLSSRFSLPLALGDFKRYKNPDQLVWVLIAAGFASLAAHNLLSLAALNVLLVITAAYFVQGMAVVAHSFQRFTVPFFVRFLFYLLLSLQPFLAVIVAALGVFDLWGDFRTPKNKQNL